MRQKAIHTKPHESHYTIKSSGNISLRTPRTGNTPGAPGKSVYTISHFPHPAALIKSSSFISFFQKSLLFLLNHESMLLTTV